MSSNRTIRHPLFARVFHGLSRREEMAGQREYRRQALTGRRGRVVELGASNDLNFAHYPDTVTEVLAVEPGGVLPRPRLGWARRCVAVV